MKHTTATEKEEYSNPKHRNSKAYERFKAKPTTYESGKKCSYGDKTEHVMLVVDFGKLA